MTQSYKYIGKGRPLVEGREKVTGAARYVADLTVPGMLYGRLVLSPHAHAEILSADKSMAETVPGVVAVLTAEDLPTRGQTMTSRYNAGLAKEKVLFVGQPVAIVVAETPAVAADAAELVFVGYEPLPAVVNLREAIQPDAPVLWPQGLSTDEDSSNLHITVDGERQTEERLNNVSASSNYQRGDIAVGFAESDVIIEQTYHLNTVHQSYLEPHASIAVPDPLGNGLTIYTSTQGKFQVRDEVAELLSLPRQQVHIKPMAIGGGFGAKYGILEPLAGAVALTIKRPVQIVLSRSEDFVTTTPTPAITIELKTGAKQDGTITALQARVLVDNGLFNFKYGSYGEVVAALLGGMYKFPHVDVNNYEVNTHKAPIGAYRAPGGPPAIFALESNIDDMAAALGLDPLEFRLQNITETSGTTVGGRAWPPPGFKMCLEQLKAHPAWQTRHTDADEGFGVALAGWPVGVGTAEAICRVDSDGSAILELGHIDVSGNDSSFVLIAAEALGLSPDDVTVIHGETTGGPYGPMSGGSQVTYSTAGAVDIAVQQAKVKLLQVAADHFEAASEDIELVDGRARVKGVPDRFITIAELVQIARYQSGGPGPIFGAGQAAIEESAPVVSVHLVKVKIDRETGQVKPLQYLMVQDVGFAINPMVVEGQLHGGMVQGLGIGLHEAMVYDETGQLLSGSFMDYGLPHIDDVPHLEAVMVKNPSPYGPFGARGVGEPPILGGAVAVANAIKDATGLRMTTAPIRAEVLWNMMHNSTAQR